VRVGAFLLSCALAFIPLSASSHSGHAEAPSAAGAAIGTQVVQVAADARKNLGLEVVEAELRPLASTLAVIGEIAPAPDRAGAVASRIAGRVVSVSVAEGDAVRRGQPVVEIESLLLGDPPPRARYASPIDGVVTDRHVVPGDSVEPNAHLLEIADLREVLAVGQLFEGQIGRVAIGQRVRVGVPSFPDVAFDGVVERLGGALDPKTRSLPVYVRVQNPRGELRPGMRAELAIVTSASDAALAVPRSAVLGDFGALFVFREATDDATRFERVSVVTGASDDQWIEIVEGLLPGDRVAMQGNYSMQFLPAAAAEPAGDAPSHEESTVGEPVGRPFLIAMGLGAIALAATSAVVVAATRARRGRS
jgi:multidrug efflux pump subunit AcrA (membrane-fusion protein)